MNFSFNKLIWLIVYSIQGNFTTTLTVLLRTVFQLTNLYVKWCCLHRGGSQPLTVIQHLMHIPYNILGLKVIWFWWLVSWKWLPAPKVPLLSRLSSKLNFSATLPSSNGSYELVYRQRALVWINSSSPICCLDIALLPSIQYQLYTYLYCGRRFGNDIRMKHLA